MKIAVVIGSTGLTGSQVVKQLLREGSFSQIIAICRSKTSALDAEFNNPKVRVLQFDFQNWQTLDLQINSFAGARPSLDFFCTLGTTMKVAGSPVAT